MQLFSSFPTHSVQGAFLLFKVKRFFKAIIDASLRLSSSPPELFLKKDVPKICSKFTGEHPWRTAISIKLQSNFIEIALPHGCSPVNLLHIFRTPFPNSTSGGLLLEIIDIRCNWNTNCKMYLQKDRKAFSNFIKK